MLEIRKAGKLDAVFTAPPSKAYTLRALFVSSFCQGESILYHSLAADDQLFAAKALQQFGAKIELKGDDFFVKGTGGNFIAPRETVFTGNSGVTTRFLLPVAALVQGKSVIDGDERMRQRPLGSLVSSLQRIGVEIEASPSGCVPVTIRGKTITGKTTSVEAQESSQFLSALLIAAPYMPHGLKIKLEGKLNSKPYIDVTLDVMKKFGVKVTNKNYKEFIVKPKQKYSAKEYRIEGDYSSASYFFAAAAVTGGRVKVENLNPKSTQGDKFFLKILKKMGCKIRMGKDFAAVSGGKLRGISIYMGMYPDLVPTLAVVAAFAKGVTKIKNIGHLAIKESNRIESVCINLRKCGVEVEYGKDYMNITGGKPHGEIVKTFNDHRIAMAFSIMGLAVRGIILDDERVVAKSYPQFFNDLERAYVIP